MFAQDQLTCYVIYDTYRLPKPSNLEGTKLKLYSVASILSLVLMSSLQRNNFEQKYQNKTVSFCLQLINFDRYLPSVRKTNLDPDILCKD